MGNKKSAKSKIINYSQGKNLRVRLRGKRLSTGNISLFLDYYQGYSRNNNDKIKTSRKLEYLKLYLNDNPRTQEERKENERNLTLAQLIRSNRESDLQHSAEGLIAPFRKKSNFFDYCDNYKAKYQKKDLRMITMAIEQYKAFTGETFLTPLQIDSTKVRGFRDYLLNKYNGETPNSVFARFKKILNAATEEGLFSRNPGEKIVCSVPDGIPKEILTADEVVRLASARCGNEQVKRAFLLCLNTGLRFCDVTDLKYKHVTNGLIKKAQQKTGREVTIDLNKAAIKLIGEIGDPEDCIFSLPSFNGCIHTLRSWAKRAGISKKITWHTARHSFATILMMNKTDIKTVGSLLGHSKLDHTQKYLRVVDRLKSVAVNTLPEIEVA